MQLLTGKSFSQTRVRFILLALLTAKVPQNSLRESLLVFTFPLNPPLSSFSLLTLGKTNKFALLSLNHNVDKGGLWAAGPILYVFPVILSEAKRSRKIWVDSAILIQILHFVQDDIITIPNS